MMKRLLLLICICIVSLTAVAQCRLTVTLSTSGNCSGSIDAGLQKSIAEGIVKHYNGKTFNSRGECNQVRNYLIREASGSSGGCTVRVNPICSGCQGAGSVDILGLDKGTSFYSTNSANEIHDWSKDYVERMIALNPDNKPQEPKTVATSDEAFNNIIENMPYSDEAFSGRMPRGSTYTATEGNITTIRQPVKGKGVLVPDDFTSKPFDYGLGIWHSEDLKPINAKLKPVEHVYRETSTDNEGVDLLRDWLKWGKDVGLSVYDVAKGVSSTGANILGDVDINLGAELYKAYKSVNDDISYEAPDNIITDAFVYWGGKEYAIVGNVFYNTIATTIRDFTKLFASESSKVIVESSMKTELPKGFSLVGIGTDAIELSSRTVDYYNQKNDE